VFGLQQNPQSPVEPTFTMTSSYALTDFEVRYWNGSDWATVPGGSVTGNDKVWRKFTFAPLVTTKIMIHVTAVAGDNRSQVVELEAYAATTSAASIQWLVSDHLGTPRMIFDQSGSLANVKRHDYLPFGEELFAGTGGRSTAQGYATGDNVRQQFTQKERDIETGLDYFLARYYASFQGRFTGVDSGKFVPADPQSWNRYAYTQNNPLKFVDLTGNDLYITGDYAEEIVKELELKSGYKLDYDKTSGKVTINSNQKRQIKNTSKTLASAIKTAITSEKDVGIKTVSESKDGLAISIDQFISRQMDVDDYRVINRDAPALATGVLTHILVEYTTAAELPSVFNIETIIKISHQVALSEDFKAVADINGTLLTVPRSTSRSGSPTAPPMIIREDYYSVQYDIILKSGVNGNATQVDKVTTVKGKAKTK